MVIRRKDTATVWIGRLNFCEVEIFSCPPGKWGVNATDPAADCSGSCKCKPEETCSVATGRNSDCLSAECSAGWWGENCEKTCHCARKCHRNTGYCDEAGCAQGYAGPLNCNTGMSTSILNLFFHSPLMGIFFFNFTVGGGPNPKSANTVLSKPF